MKRRPLLLATLALPVYLSAQDLNPVRIGLREWATGLSGPVALANAGDDRLFVAERMGRIKIITDSMTVSGTQFLNITDRVNSGASEQGLLSLVFAPDYATSGHFYVYYIAGTGSGTSRISRFTVSDDANVADPDSEEIIYTWPQPEWNHNGADLHFGPDGMLYCGFGDGGSGNDPWNNAQDLTDPLGDMIRIDVSVPGATFAIPSDNPYAEAGGDTLPEIWASGLRNPWRFSIDPVTGNMWIGDVGQNAFEEIDVWPTDDHSGPNFGWRCREGLVATPGLSQAGCGTAADYVSPVAVFNHTSQGWCSVIGGHIYHGQWPHLQGKYLFTDYCAGDFLTFGEGYDVDTLLTTTTFGYAAFGVDDQGEHYVVNSSQGTVRKIYDACPMDDPTITETDGVLTATSANTYQWYRNGVAVSGATLQSFTPTTGGNYHVVVSFGAPCSLRSEVLTVVVTGLSEATAGGYRLFPVPAQEAVTVERSKEETGRREVWVLDAPGRVVHRSVLAQDQWRTTISLTGLADGLYQVRILDPVSGQARTLPLVVGH